MTAKCKHLHDSNMSENHLWRSLAVNKNLLLKNGGATWWLPFVGVNRCVRRRRNFKFLFLPPSVGSAEPTASDWIGWISAITPAVLNEFIIEPRESLKN